MCKSCQLFRMIRKTICNDDSWSELWGNLWSEMWGDLRSESHGDLQSELLGDLWSELQSESQSELEVICQIASNYFWYYFVIKVALIFIHTL